MTLLKYAVIVVGIVPLLWGVADIAVGAGDVSFFPMKLPSYFAGVINGMPLERVLVWLDDLARCHVERPAPQKGEASDAP